jgi:hypothetical protein
MTVIPAGPYKVLSTASGEMPWYMMPFDRDGICTAPRTREHLMTAIAAELVTDIILFCHGWNNDWKYATARYQSFIEGYSKLRTTHQLALPNGYHPLFVGVFWPSMILLTEREQPPQILAVDGPNEDAIVEERERIAELAGAVNAPQRERFYGLIQRAALSEEEAEELAGILQPIYSRANDELPIGAPATPANIVNGWLAAANAQPPAATKETFGAATGRETGRAQTAGSFGDALRRVLPRDVIRLATVYQMKDRAGRVGATGVRALVEDLLANNKNARLHLLGHSYGCKVLLSALATASLGSGRTAHSMLLLQPAVSHLCFAGKLPGSGGPGGYRSVLPRVARPIFATYSTNDFPLHEVFHRALWRSADKGEVGIAAFGGEPPNIYAALGGYGPRDSDQALIDITQPVVPLDLKQRARLYGVDGTATISGHGDISNDSTWWLSYCASWQQV